MKHSFKESYGVLQRHAQTLREQREPNIDARLQIVEESVSAFKICQARIDAVEKALEKELGEPQREAAERSPAASAAPAPKSAAAATSPTDDDVPF